MGLLINKLCLFNLSFCPADKTISEGTAQNNFNRSMLYYNSFLDFRILVCSLKMQSLNTTNHVPCIRFVLGNKYFNIFFRYKFAYFAIKSTRGYNTSLYKQTAGKLLLCNAPFHARAHTETSPCPQSGGSGSDGC